MTGNGRNVYALLRLCSQGNRYLGDVVRKGFCLQRGGGRIASEFAALRSWVVSATFQRIIPKLFKSTIKEIWPLKKREKKLYRLLRGKEVSHGGVISSKLDQSQVAST